MVSIFLVGHKSGASDLTFAFDESGLYLYQQQ